MLKKSFLFSVAIHAVLIAIAAYWVLQIHKPNKPKPIHVTIVTLPPIQQIEPKHVESKPTEPIKKEIPEPQKPIITKPKPAIIPIAKSQPVVAPIPVATTVAKPIEKEVPSTPPQQQIVVPKAPPTPPKPSQSEISQAKNQYLNYLRQSIDEHKIYPKNAKRLGQTGTVEITFTVMTDGTITNVRVKQTSNFELLDKAATDILTTLAKVRPIPKELGKESWEITLPIEYQLN